MKKPILIILLAIPALTFILLISCDKDDPPAPLEGKLLSLYTKDYTIWHYFSFELDSVIGTGSADPADSDDAAWKVRSDWDLAFHYKDVRTNGGKSGNGNGGMLEASDSVFGEVLEAPISGYTEDDSLDIMLSSAMPPVYTKSTANSVCDDWAYYDHDEHAWIFADKIFIVRTADGKYAKIWLKNFLDNEDNSGTITMEYMYQPDGSTKLE